MTPEIHELLKQSLHAHYRYMLPRVKEKDRQDFKMCYSHLMGFPAVVNFDARGTKLMEDTYYEILNKINERFIYGASRDFIFEKL